MRAMAAIGAALVMIALVVLVVQVAGLRRETADALSEARAATAAADAAASAIDELRTDIRSLIDELARIPRRGIVPTDSSGLILERMTEIRDEIAQLTDRVDAICENAPVSLC
jgi:hypothetical protein